MEFLELTTWYIIGKIIVIDILLAGDNAVVIGMAAGRLAPALQKKAIFWGTAGAIGLRLLFATILVEALHYVPAIHLVGGIVLLWIAIQLLCGGDEDNHVEAKDSLLGAIITIILADAMMSIDNVIGVVGAAGGHLEMVVVGMLITVPLIVYGATIFTKILNRYPIILWFGGALLGWVGGEMISADPLLKPFIGTMTWPVEVAGVAIVLMAAGLINQLRRRQYVQESKN